ncbi:hypothetical protein N7499_002897 [Penicillium canescens]|uniref:Xylanolytic transcriptional activator regulatory domain-containing protein n=1 Tax=Penicillium canescens TaxID=5083 RepID=A0AAD6HXX6_PENCN|nr:uncharacterized protein N7446_014137 [Penicillium canescens]KAJ6022340.1 hypothetical protein N7460_014084 [Penicillium canescens]KAJ6038985.1 hypothetical protein N7446_014137 [Penicillium canescens]KAJ6066225.1 hypothetical protein N7444_000217 [Penicillium canescens]KAJ6094301.1 hypothetical protein N7499_002897 [Penicillium canescens]KAJ6174661.1 hypothetical protein N7485_005398 [Penicillium canescens]
MCNTECTYDAAQDRRRPVSKAYVAALENRVAWLEGLWESQKEEAGEIEEELEDGERDRPCRLASEPQPDRELSHRPVEHLQIDNITGEVREYGPTSMFKHLPATENSSTSPEKPRTSSSTTITTHSGKLALSGLQETFDKAMHLKALRAFFAFFNPWCWWVDEKRFRDDMGTVPTEASAFVRNELRTDHYSPLLHFAILAIGVMYLNEGPSFDRGRVSDSFARNAATFFEEEIESAKLSAVVGLMLLGSHHAGHARQSLGYIYSGTGMRLTRILGLSTDVSSWVDKGLISPETKRSRDRIWNNVYIQDKLWSTYVGRAPAPNLSNWHMVLCPIDKEEDARPWHGLDDSESEPVRSSWVASTLAWTCKLARIIELTLTHIYSTRTSGKIRNNRYDLCVLLEKWNEELPEQLRVSSSMLRGQGVLSILPHVLVMNIMFHFAIILLNRPDSCGTPQRRRPISKTHNSDILTTATEKCNQAAVKVLHLAEVFDRTYGLRCAPVSMTQFIFTAGTVHLPSAANNQKADLDVDLVKRYIDLLQSMGQTWQCAAQSADVMKRLLQECCNKLISLNEIPGPISESKNSGRVNGSSSPSMSRTIDIQEMIRQKPEVVQQLQRLGWVPPPVDPATCSSSGIPSNGDTLSMTPSSVQVEGSGVPTAQQYHATHDAAIEDTSWMLQPDWWADHSYTSSLSPLHGQSLFDMLIANNIVAPDYWTSNPFNVEMGDGRPPGWGTFAPNGMTGI